MLRLRALPLALVLAACPVGTAAAAVGSGCGDGTVKVEPSEGRDWIKSERPLFVIDAQGRLWRGDLAWTTPVLLADHGFKEQPHARRSEDGRYVVYGGDMAGTSVRRWWLLDLASATERLIHESSAAHSGLPRFSPDGEWISIYHSSSRLTPGDPYLGLRLISTATGEHVHVGDVPSPPLPMGGRVVGAQWTTDGKSLVLIGFDTGNDRLFFEYTPFPSENWSLVPGNWPQNGANPSIQRGGVDVPLAGDSYMPSRVRYGARESGDGRWQATIDDQHRLHVVGPGGKRVHAATGTYDMCEGITIGIHGWFDDRYLVYSLANIPYLLDPETGRQLRLFDDDDIQKYFFW